LKTESRSISKAGLALIEKTRFPGREEFRWSGLTLSVSGIEALIEDVTKKYDVFLYKKNIDFVWVMFMGGTGPGSRPVQCLVGDTVSRPELSVPDKRALGLCLSKDCIGGTVPIR